MSGIKEYIRESTAKFKAGFTQPGDISIFIRALTARVLWVTFVYTLLLAFTPYQDFLTQNGAIVMMLAAASFLWGKVLKDLMPEWCDEVLTGKIFLREENIAVLNTYIFGLTIAVLFSIFMLPKLLISFNKRA